MPILKVDDYDSLDFLDATLSEPVAIGDDLVVHIEGLQVVPDAQSRVIPLPPLRMVFVAVARSSRTIHRYVGPKSLGTFELPINVEDLPPRSVSADREAALKHFWLEGVQEHPRAWVEWVVVACEFRLEELADPAGVECHP